MLNIARHYATHGGNNSICELDSCRSLSQLHTVKQRLWQRFGGWLFNVVNVPT